MDNIKIKKFSTAIVCLSAFIAMLCALEFLPKTEYFSSLAFLYVPVFTAVISIVLIYVYATCGYYFGTLVSILGFGTAAVLDFSAALYIAAGVLPLVLTAGYMIYSQKRFIVSITACTAAAAAGAALVFLLISQLSGTTVVEFAAKLYGQQLNSLSNSEIAFVYGILRYPDILSGAVTQEVVSSTLASDAVIKMQDMLRNGLNISIVYYMTVYSVAAGYLAYIIPRAVAKKQGRYVADIPKLKDYELPPRLWIAAVCITSAAFIGESLGLESFDIVLYTVLNVFVFLFAIQGFCLLLYFFDKRDLSGGLKAVLLIAALLFLRTVALPLIGFIENIFNLRKKINNLEEGQI